MITLKAKFIGKTSLGFTTNKEYELMMDLKSTEIDIESKVGVFPNEEVLRCVYSNISKFLENWEVLSINGMDTKSKHCISGYTITGTTTTGTTTQNTTISNQAIGMTGYIGYASMTGTIGYSGTVGYQGVTGYSGYGKTGMPGTPGHFTKNFDPIVNEIRSDMRNNKLEKILSPLTNGKNSLV